MIELALRHMRRNWRTNLAVLLCMTLASALLAGFAGYTEAIAVQELSQTLDEARPAERSILVVGPRPTFSEEMYALLQRALGDVIEERLVIRQAFSPAEQPSMGETDERQAVDLLTVYSFDKLAEHVRVVEGRLPDQVRLREATEYWRPPPMETVLGARAAEESGYRVGDRLIGSGGYHRLDIVGIVEPQDPDADIWGEDLSAFAISRVGTESSADLIALSVIIAPASMRSSYPEQPIFLHQVSWRITLNRQLVDSVRAETLLPDLINLRTQSATRNATIVTDLINILASYLARLSRVRISFYLLTAQTLLFVLYTLTVFTSFAINRSRVELATLSARGANLWQMVGVFALENLLVALPAGLLLGPGLAYSAIRLWSITTGEVALLTLPSEAWVLSGVAVTLGWLALVLPILLAARRRTLEWQLRGAGPPHRPVTQKHYLDLYLLCFGALLYWQLNRSGSFVMHRLRDTQFADPLLLIGPSLLLVAAAMLSLRLMPPVLRLVARLARRMRGLVLPMSAYRLTRDPAQPARVVLLVGLTAGLLLFTRAFGSSLTYSQQETARYLSGADLRVALDQPDGLTLAELDDLDGVQASSPALRGIGQLGDGQDVNLLAVDPDSLAQVTRFPAGLGNARIPDLLRLLESESAAAQIDNMMLPAIISSPTPPEGIDQGDLVPMQLGPTFLHVSVEAIVDGFPGLAGFSVIVSLPQLEALVGQDALDSFASNEAWLDVDPEQHESLTGAATLQGLVLDDSQAQLQALQSDALALGMHRALRLNALALVLFSVITFCLIYFVATQEREREFRTLQVIGLESRQMVGLVVTEGMLSLFVGLLVGTGLGLGLSHIMIPYLSQPLAESLAGAAIERLVVDWPSVALVFAQMIFTYGVALVILMLALARSRSGRILLAEE